MNMKNGLLYVGKTSDSFYNRLNKHISNARNEKPGQKLETVMSEYGEKNFEFYILEIIDKDKSQKYFFKREEGTWRITKSLFSCSMGSMLFPRVLYTRYPSRRRISSNVMYIASVTNRHFPYKEQHKEVERIHKIKRILQQSAADEAAFSVVQADGQKR